MSRIQLSPNEARIIGCLMEKAILTPEQCPLTLNALTTACNQKTSREPVLALDRATVERAARDLREKSLVTRDENFRSGVVKYQQQSVQHDIQRAELLGGRVRGGLPPAPARPADPRRTAIA